MQVHRQPVKLIKQERLNKRLAADAKLATKGKTATETENSTPVTNLWSSKNQALGYGSEGKA